MQTLRGNSWHPWIIVGNILMAAIVGLVVGVLLIFFNIGGLLTIVGVSAFLAHIRNRALSAMGPGHGRGGGASAADAGDRQFPDRCHAVRGRAARRRTEGNP